MTQHFVKDHAAVAAWKKAHKKTDKDLGQILRVHPITVSKWINRMNAIPYAWAKLLAETIGVPFENLIETSTTCAPEHSQPTARTAEQVIEHAQLPGAQPQSEVA